MSYMFKFKNNQRYTVITSILILLFTSYVVNAKSVPESFADLAEALPALEAALKALDTLKRK